jgi:membrane associated rhomboid family serine protease
MMDLATVAGVSWQAAVVGLVAGIGAVFTLAWALARRSRRRDRTLVSLNGRE